MFKKTLLALTVSAIAVSTSVAASPFEGPYVGATLGMMKTDISGKSTIGKVKFSEDGAETNVGLNIGYAAINGSFFGAVEAGYRENYGEAKESITQAKFKGKHGWEVSVLPGYLINKTTLVYGRLGMGSVKGELSVLGMSGSEDIDTTVWGLGFQKAFTNQLSVKLEYNRTNFDDKIDGVKVRGDSSGFMLGAQYSF